jgi:AcrR family transcriptional regulator
MKQGNKQNYHHGDLRTALIQAAEGIIDQEGIEAVTMRRLSELTGVSHAAPYRHFEDKTALLTAAATEGFRRFRNALRTARLDASADMATRFRNMGRAYLRFATENAACYRLMFGRAPLRQDPELCEASDAAFGELLAAIEQLQQQGLIRRDDPHAQAVYVWSLMHGLASLTIDGKLRECRSEMQEVLSFVECQALCSLGHDGNIRSNNKGDHYCPVKKLAARK